MAEILPFRRTRRWTRASDYGVPVRRRGGRGRGGGRGGRGGGGWLTAARETGPILWVAPLAVGVAVFLSLGDATRPIAESEPARAWQSVTEAELRARIWPNDPAELDAQQPDLSAPDISVSRSSPGRGADTERASFGSCGAGASRQACVVDGDTFWYRGEKIRVADINTPETSRPKCAAEAALGARATARFAELMNAGAFTLEPVDRSHDKYGRALFVVMRGGESVGGVLVAEGLAEEWQGYRREWC